MVRLLADERCESERGLLESDDVDKEVNADQEGGSGIKLLQSRSFGVLSLLVTLVCSAVNFYIWAESRPSVSPRALLQRPSPYMGLADVARNLTEEATLHFATFPPILTQISQTQPDRVWPDDTTQGLRPVGTVSPDERHFFVSSKVSSVAQFRAIDYGFEYCAVQFNMRSPVRSALSISPGLVSIHVWLLDESPRMDVRQLSWSTRPSRKRLLDTVRLSHDSVATTKSIRCPWGSFPSFEFACEQDSCLVDFWQNPKVSDLGVTMVQRSSLV